jgi:GxxExxY protein
MALDGSKEINQLTQHILDISFRIHSKLGPGLFESVYEEILAHELIKSGNCIQRQVSLPVHWDSLTLQQAFRIDLLVNEQVVVEIKSIENLGAIHHKQLTTYLKLSNLKLGLLINFNETRLKHGIVRIVNGL